MVGIYGIHSFTLNRYNGLDSYNNPQARTPVSKTGFFEYKNQHMKNTEGEEIVSKANVRMQYDSAVTANDTVTYDSIEWRIVVVSRPTDFGTGQHLILWLV